MTNNIFDQFDQTEDLNLQPQVSQTLTEDIKNPFSETQNKAAAFAYRQLKAIEETDALIAGGYNPSSDLYNYMASALPDIFEGWATTSKYQQWERAKIDFSTAQLRPETGAVINDTLWEKFGQKKEVQLAKREARYRAHIGNKTVAGKAYDKLVKEMEAGDQEKIVNDSFGILKNRANNGELNEEQLAKFKELERLRKQ